MWCYESDLDRVGISGEEVNGLDPKALVGVNCVEEQRQRCINMCSSSSKKNVHSKKSKRPPVARWALDGSLILQDLEGI